MKRANERSRHGAQTRRGIKRRLLVFVGGLFFDATTHLASGALEYVKRRRRARRAAGRSR